LNTPQADSRKAEETGILYLVTVCYVPEADILNKKDARSLFSHQAAS